MTNEERQEMVTEARLFALAAPVVLPLIERRKKHSLDKLLAAHREGRTDTTTLVAELSVLSDLERDIKQKETIYLTLEERQHARPDRK